MATIAGKKQRKKRKKLSLTLGEKRRSQRNIVIEKASESRSPESESKENSSQRQSHRVHPHAQPGPGTS